MKLIIVMALSFSVAALAEEKNISNTPIRVAITVDDLPMHGPLPAGVSRDDITKKMVAAFKKHGIKEAFGFINAGKQLLEPHNVYKIWLDAGYPLGNHAFTHMNLNSEGVEPFKEDIKKNEPELEKLMSGRDWHFFRYPYLHEGATPNERVQIRQFLAQNGYKIAQVSIDFEDWSWNEPYIRCLHKRDTKSIAWLKKTYVESAVRILRDQVRFSRAVFKRDINHILLLHVGALDAELADELVTAYKNNGVEFISLAEATSDEVYAMEPVFTGPRGREFPQQIAISRGLKGDDLVPSGYDSTPQKKLRKICR